VTHLTRPALPSDQPAVRAIAHASGLFTPNEAAMMDGMIADQFADLTDHCWIILQDLTGAAYLAPEMAQGTWNMLFIAVLPARRGKGGGTALLQAVQAHLRAQGARLMIVETSGLGTFAQTRAFYAKAGFDEEARIRDFYATGDDKVVFRKVL
jgi:ribosomal protein S18 acetylase RimI-like enzyme